MRNLYVGAIAVPGSRHHTVLAAGVKLDAGQGAVVEVVGELVAAYAAQILEHDRGVGIHSHHSGRHHIEQIRGTGGGALYAHCEFILTDIVHLHLGPYFAGHIDKGDVVYVPEHIALEIEFAREVKQKAIGFLSLHIEGR